MAEDEFLAALKGEKPMVFVIGSAVRVEAKCKELLSEALEPGILDVEKLDMGVVLGWCRALGLLGPVFADAAKRLMTIRNRFAHDPAATLVSEDARQFVNVLKKNEASKVMLKTPKTPAELFAAMRDGIQILVWNLDAQKDRCKKNKNGLSAFRAEMLKPYFSSRGKATSKKRSI